jgi:hypothetical protein
MKKTKLLFIAIVAAAIFITLYPLPAFAQPPARVNIYAWTDKTSYELGEKGKLTIVVRNDRTDVDLILYNVTIEYPWFAFTGEKWEGNATITEGLPVTLTKNGGSKKFTVDFTVPTDGRALTSMYGASIEITVYVDKAPYTYSHTASIYVKSMPILTSLENWDDMMTLFTIHVILMIVCTIIIASVVFLSTRRPRAVWVEEEKEKSE